jgi:DNA-binding IclR family transcriptional regulator
MYTSQADGRSKLSAADDNLSDMPDKAQVPAADQTLRVLTFLATQRASVPAAVVATALGIPRSTMYHLLSTLATHGFVVNGDRRWALGPAAHDLGTGYVRQQPLTLAGRAIVSGLVDSLAHNAHLAVLLGREVVYVIEERAPGRPSLVTDVGVRLPAHLTASGRSMLAAMSREQILAVYPDDASLSVRGDTSMTRKGLLEELRATRARGYATEHGEITAGLSSVAVSVLDRVNWPIAALAITFEGDIEVDPLVSALRNAVSDLSRRLRV